MIILKVIIIIIIIIIIMDLIMPPGFNRSKTHE